MIIEKSYLLHLTLVVDFSIDNTILKLNKEFLNVVNGVLFLENNSVNWVSLNEQIIGS